MPVLAANSLWMGPNIGITSVAIPTGTIVTATVSSTWNSLDQTVTLFLYAQNNVGTPTDLPAGLTLVLRQPNGLEVVCQQSVHTGVPTITQPNGVGSGFYQLSLSAFLQGRWGYTWVLNGVDVMSGDFNVVAAAI